MEVEKENKGALKYIIYQLLYVNDIACNSVNELAPIMRNCDSKNAKKIYGALVKRQTEYWNMINDIIHDKALDAFVEYCSNMDDNMDELSEELYEALYDYFEPILNDKTEMFAKLEFCYQMIDVADTFFKLSKKDLIKFGYDATRLNYLSISRMKTAITNLLDWLYVLAKREKVQEINIDGNEKIFKALKALTTKLLSVDLFNQNIKAIDSGLNTSKPTSKRVMVKYKDEKVIYDSISKAAETLHCSRTTIENYSQSGKLYRKIFTIKIL